MVLALFVIALCIWAITEAARREEDSEEPTYVFIEESEDWLWPSREWAQSETEERP